MVGDLFEALVGDAAAARDVAQERDHVVLALGPTEAREQDGVVCDRRLDVLGAVRRRRRLSPGIVIARPPRSRRADSTAGVERHLFAHVPPGIRLPQVAHEVDEVDKLGGLEREDPLVVAQREARDRVGEHLRYSEPLRPWSPSIARRSSSGSRYHS